MKNAIYKLLLLLFPILALTPNLAYSQNIKLTPIAKRLESPLFLTASQDNKRLFIVQQNGVVLALEGEKLSTVLNISKKVTHSGESGLLGLALHPDFLANNLAYLSYTTKQKGKLVSIIEEYRFNPQNNKFDENSARLIYSLPQPAANHNGGMLAFGPDGYLYIGFGDGGGANDTYNKGQDFDSALGTIVRIRVGENIKTYEIPRDNPRPNSQAPESWIYGLRNPWRFSFDGELLYIGDVGQSGQEEISIIEAGAKSSGANLGWPLAEGNNCLKDKNCKQKDLIFPQFTYPTKEGCSVIGGYVYRGKSIPQLRGHYFYGDFCSGKIFSFKYQDETILDFRDWSDILGRVQLLSSFGTDANGELYIISLGGDIYRLDNK